MLSRKDKEIVHTYPCILSNSLIYISREDNELKIEEKNKTTGQFITKIDLDDRVYFLVKMCSSI